MKINIEEELFKNQDLKYQQFQQKLIPNTNNIIGVRTPVLRKLAKQIIHDDPLSYLDNAKTDSFEEVLLKGIVIGYLKEEYPLIKNYIINFIPKITNWALCDIFCGGLKITSLYKEDMYLLIQSCLKSNEEYTIRFGIVMLLNYYVEESYFQEVSEQLENIPFPPYYVQMAIAWALSMYYIKFPLLTSQYLKKSTLDDFTFHKTIQKISDSYCVDQESKDKIKQLKRPKKQTSQKKTF